MDLQSEGKKSYKDNSVEDCLKNQQQSEALYEKNLVILIRF